MIYDIHAHVIGLESGHAGNYLCPPRARSLVLRVLLKRILRAIPVADGISRDQAIRTMVWEWIAASRIDKAVILALDGVYGRDGGLDLNRTQLITSNEFVASFVSGNSKLLFGASIHPYRKDAIDALDRAVEQGAALIKWLPSAQGIVPDDALCHPFYERMASHGIPLLTHTGIEHTLPRFSHSLNDPSRFIPALRRGVTVIAAHCGTRIYPHERSRFDEWTRLAREYSNFYGDLSAFGLPMHGRPLRRILDDPALRAKVLYGSDFPIVPIPFWYSPNIGWRKACALRAIRNPFDQAYMTMKALGVTEEIFCRAGTLMKCREGSPSS